ncbi:MAG: hypothetical protein SGPRY_015049, partial [Prymnesium sp.]
GKEAKGAAAAGERPTHHPAPPAAQRTHVKLTKGIRGLGVTTDESGVINHIDLNCPIAFSGELHLGAL